jgi:O-antigen/teichoic acid export membrane protein
LTGHGVVAFALVFAGIRVLDTAGLAAYVHLRVLPLRLSRDVGLWRELLRKGLPFAYAGLVITLVFQLDIVLLESFRGPTEAAWYRTPTLILEGLTLVPRFLGYALIPVMASLHRTAPASVGELYRRGCKYLTLAGLPIAAFGILASDRLIPLLFGADYGPSVHVSRILLPAAFFMFLSNFSETTLACIDRWRAIVLASTAALVLNVALNLAWIPRMGYRGSAWATLATEAFYWAATAYAVAASGHRVSWLPLMLRPAAAAGAFAAVLWWAGSLHVVVAAVLASAAFAGLTFALGIWDAKERAALRELLLGRRPDPRALI